MNKVLSHWNRADEATARDAMLACCAAPRWADAMIALRPFSSVEALSLAADKVWSTMQEPDWMEAFAAHPRIGERRVSSANTTSSAWSREEQSSAAAAPASILLELAEGNGLYERLFGFTYIVCATGKSAQEMLAILRRRLTNDRQKELREAAEQQRQIMQIRLGKWLVE